MSLVTLAAAQLLRALPRVRISRAVGRLCDSQMPASLCRTVQSVYCRAYGVDMADVDIPPLGFPSFDAFFTRPLRAGSRPISGDPLVSPADGLLAATGTIDRDLQLLVKRQLYRVEGLLENQDEAARYRGGQFAVVYLSPRDYHRVHAPVAGREVLVRSIVGDLFPVNAIGERHVERLFIRNQRVVIAIDTQEMGRVMVVLVGAMIVGRISVTAVPGGHVPPGEYPLNPPRPIQKGDEIGIFHLGSTVVLLLESGVTISRPVGKVRYGESLLRP